jgi:hypothetical protein
LRLNSGRQSTLVSGTLSFARDANLEIETTGARAGKNQNVSDSVKGHVLKISGPLDGPKVSAEKTGVRQPAD